MADATTAARDRIDRALAALESKIADLKAQPVSGPAVDDDLFARAPGDAEARARIAALEAAGRDASDALGRAAEALRRMAASGDDVEDED